MECWIAYVPIVAYVWRIIPSAWELVSCMHEYYEYPYFDAWYKMLWLLYGVYMIPGTWERIYDTRYA